MRRGTATGPYASIGIIACNEEQTIGPMLESVFKQTLLEQSRKRGRQVEVVCLANGCTDNTAGVAEAVFRAQSQSHPFAGSFVCRVLNLDERGKINAWNQFVHSVSAHQAKFLFLMDADIILLGRETLWNMLVTLEADQRAQITVDLPCKEFGPTRRRTLVQRLSLAASRITRSAQAQLCGQLYCIRAAVARKIYLPRHLTACDDGFIKTLVCTDFLTRPPQPFRIRVAPNAAHSFRAYTSLGAILQNQKRQAIGQTIVHILVDQFLNRPGCAARTHLAQWVKEKERDDPNWLRRLIGEHLRRTRFCWQLYPRLLSSRFRPLRGLGFFKKAAHLPAAALGSVLALISSFRAYAFLKAGHTEFWPQAARRDFIFPAGSPRESALPLNQWKRQPE